MVFLNPLFARFIFLQPDFRLTKRRFVIKMLGRLQNERGRNNKRGRIMENVHVGARIRMVSNLIYRRINQMCASEGEELTAHQDWVLRYLLDHQDQDIFQRDMERVFQIRRSTASRALALMEENGYIFREPVPGDGRMKRIVVTEKGRTARARMSRRLNRFEEELQAGISQEEREIFLRLLHRLEENIECAGRNLSREE